MAGSLAWRLPHLLHLDSSADEQRSRSRAVTATFAAAWRDHGAGYPGVTAPFDVPTQPLAGRPAETAKRLAAPGLPPSEERPPRQQTRG